jgi:hypothetical protein
MLTKVAQEWLRKKLARKKDAKDVQIKGPVPQENLKLILPSLSLRRNFKISSIKY